MKKVICTAILAAFSIGLVAETVLYVLGAPFTVGDLVELGVCWGVVLVGFIALIARLISTGGGYVGVGWFSRSDDGEDDYYDDGVTEKEETEEEEGPNEPDEGTRE